MKEDYIARAVIIKQSRLVPIYNNHLTDNKKLSFSFHSHHNQITLHLPAIMVKTFHTLTTHTTH